MQHPKSHLCTKCHVSEPTTLLDPFSSRLFILLALSGILFISSVGCEASAENAAHVRGKITIDGGDWPADATGSLTFQTTESGQGKTAWATVENGTYNCPEVPLGPLRVFITVQRPTGRTIDNGRGTPSEEYENIISPKYSSGIEILIEGDRDDQDFDLSTS